jgi:uncharacterized protein
MKIRLNEVPEEGENYDYNRKTGELNEVLRDLIQNNDYKVDLFIKPLNSKDFTVTGKLETSRIEQCARCAEDFKKDLKKKVNEILIPSQEQDRTGKYSKSSVNIDDPEDEVSVSEYHKQQFDLGEFIHEAVALEISYVAYCENCSKPENDKVFVYDEEMGEETTKQNPFQALKGLKLN